MSPQTAKIAQIPSNPTFFPGNKNHGHRFLFRRYREGNLAQLALFCPCGALPPLTAGLCHSCYWKWRHSLRFFGGGPGSCLGERWPALPGLRFRPLDRRPPPPAGFEHPVLITVSLRRLSRHGSPPALPLEVNPDCPGRALGRATSRRPYLAADRALSPVRAAVRGKGSRPRGVGGAWRSRLWMRSTRSTRQSTLNPSYCRKRIPQPFSRRDSVLSSRSPKWSSTASAPNTPGALTGGLWRILLPGTGPSRDGHLFPKPSFRNTAKP